jgi:hypothetical protein
VLAWAWKRRWRLAAAVLVAAAGGYFGFYEDTRSWWMAVCHRARVGGSAGFMRAVLRLARERRGDVAQLAA